MTARFRLNPTLDLGAAGLRYAADSRIRLADLLAPASAETLARCLGSEAAWSQAFYLDGNVQEKPVESLQALSGQQKRELLDRVYALAGQGTGYWYGRHGIDRDSPSTLSEFADWLNGEEVLQAMRAISGCPGLASCAAQGSRFLPGDFLTRHRDTYDQRHRKLAFVINLSPQWHPDWGGLLQFYSEDGTPRDAWAPTFNSLSLFDVEHIHAVTTVAPFARAPRLAVSGWFRLR